MNLADVLNRAAGNTPPTEQAHLSPTETLSSKPSPPSRQGKKAVTGHFDPLVSRELKQIALEHDTTIQALLAEALNGLFEKYGKRPIA